MLISHEFYLLDALILFSIGAIGVLLNRKNIIVMLLSLELILLAVSFNFILSSVFFDDIAGEVFALIILRVAAAESAIGLAILVVYSKSRGSISIDNINVLKG
jgi:NADH-quinone oxidoreductase subunit K